MCRVVTYYPLFYGANGFGTTPIVKLAVFMFLLLGSFTSAAQDLTESLDKYLDRELSKLNVPELEILVLQGDSVLFSRSVGQSTSTSSYYIGSVSKSLTAFGVLRLVKSGQLELNAKVTDILPTLDLAANGKDLTIRHLLTHTSGINKQSGFSDLPSLQVLEGATYQIDNRAIQPLRHEYSNLNYALLGLVIEKVSQKPFGDYMRQAVFEPLSMVNTRTGSRSELQPYLIDHYQYFGPFPVKSRQLEFSQTSIPAGFISSSAKDLKNYLKVNLDKGTFENKQILDAELCKTMHTTWDGSDYGYAMGWKKGTYNGQKYLQHLGSTANSYSGVFLMPEKKIGFVLLSNTNSLDFTESLAEGVLNILTDGSPKEASGLERLLRIGILLGYFVLGLFYMIKLMKVLRSADPIPRKKALLDAATYVGLLVCVFLFFPIVAKVPFASFLQLQPDLGFLILLSMLLPISLSIFQVFRKIS